MDGLKRNLALVGIFLVSLILVAFLRPFSSLKPDGLERVAEIGGFAGKARGIVSAELSDKAKEDKKKREEMLFGISAVVLLFSPAAVWIIKRSR